MTLDEVPITLIGHAFAPIGMGEQLRSHLAAMEAVSLDPRVLDIFRHDARLDDDIARVIGDREARIAPRGIRIFHINGDEIERALAAFAAAGGGFRDGVNVIVPAWELPFYPVDWVPGLRKFDEVWAISRFVADSLAASGVRSHVLGQSVEPAPGALLPRRFFGIRESAFVLLSFLDVTSYPARKNVAAALTLFARLRAARPWADVQCVLKVKHGAGSGADWARHLPPDPRRVTLTEPLDAVATRSLLSACDCFVSLHRAEGFGRAIGEALALGRLALATGWSGNMDFMDGAPALIAPYRLVPVKRGDYPHTRGQHWAEPDVDAALDLLLPYVEDRQRAVLMGARARAHVLAQHGHRAVGARIVDRLRALLPRLSAPGAA